MYLQSTGFEELSFQSLSAVETSNEALARILEEAICEETNKPLLLMWMGHGLDGGGWAWAFKGKSQGCITYKDLEEAIKIGVRPILILNDACGGGELAGLISESSSLSKRVGVIAASGKHGTAQGGDMLIEVLSAWSIHQVFEPADIRLVIKDLSPVRERHGHSIAIRTALVVRNVFRYLRRQASVPEKIVLDFRDDRVSGFDVTAPDLPVRGGTRLLDQLFFSSIG